MQGVVSVKLLSDNGKVPVRGSVGAAGADLFAAENVVILPHERALVPTDISIAFDDPGYYARIAPRSGLAIKNFIGVGAGVVDSDYRGPISVVLFNHGGDYFHVNRGDRIAQLIFERISQPVFQVVDELPTTERGSGGFGSTGK